MDIDNSKEWHWLTGGILVSLLSVATYFIFPILAGRDYPFGVTAGFGYIAGKFGSLFHGLSSNPVIKRFSEKPDAIVELFILLGLVIGGYTASRRAGSTTSECIPSVWEKHHGSNRLKRGLFVIVGSLLLGYGAALASGCTTGNILQGWAHLSLGSLVAGVSFFASGMVVAKLLYPKSGGGQ